MSHLVPQPPANPREALRRAIQADEARLRNALHDLSHAVRARTDVSGYARQRPYTWLGVAFVAGFVWGMGSNR